MNYYLSKIRQLLKQKNLDAIILYSNPYDDRYLRAIGQTNSILQNYLLISANEAVVTTPTYLVDDLRGKTNIDVIPAPAEALVFEPILEPASGKKVGYAGNCHYQDLSKLKTEPVNLNLELNQILIHKTDSFINDTSKIAKITANFMSQIDIGQINNLLELKQKVKSVAISHNLELNFPSAITASSDLEKTTAMMPKNKIIAEKEIICLDMGFKNNLTMTDRTRMYFKNMPEAKQLYSMFKQIHWEIIDTDLKVGLPFTEVIELYQSKVRKKLNYQILADDFGHGIGFSLHEKPFLEKSPSEIKRSQIFTLEPTMVTPYGKMRVEDMIAVNSSGIVENLTKKQP